MVTIGTRRAGDRYVGVLRTGKTELAACGHEHINRDQTGRGGTSARGCITEIVRATMRPALRDHLVAQTRRRWQTLGRGFQVPASTITRARIEAEQDAGKLDQLITEVAELLATHDTAVQLDRSGGTRLVPTAQ
jgi:hypothetical protein